MKRNLVALAVAGAFLAPAAAWADGSGIVLTGVIHGDIGAGEEEREDGTKVYDRQANIGTFATRWEIDGTEDLGWSQVIFGLAFDQQFAGPGRGGGITRNNNQISPNGLENRNSYLGLTGGWGTLKIGQNEHQYEIQQILQDPDPASESQYGTLSLMTGYGIAASDGTLVGGGTLPGFTRRDPQSIWYTSPNFGGVTIDLAYITPAGRKTEGIGGASSVTPQGAQLAIQWKSAFGLSIYGAVAQYDDEAVGSFGNFDNKNSAGRIGVGFGTELFQIDVAAEQLKFKSEEGDIFVITSPIGALVTTTASGDNVKRTNFMVSGSLNFGQHHIRAAANFAAKAKVGGETIDDSEARLFYLGYGYTLSKRTELQVIYGKVDNKDNANFSVVDRGNDSDRIGFGLRHTF